jgi:hypothetical protein
MRFNVSAAETAANLAMWTLQQNSFMFENEVENVQGRESVSPV